MEKSKEKKKSPVQTVMIVDDSFNYHTHLNTNHYALSFSLIVFSNPCDSFTVSTFVKNGSNLIGKW